jgi:hypothetical protein
VSKATAEHRRRRRAVKGHRGYGVVSVNERFVSLRLCLGVLCRDRTVSGCGFMMGSGERWEGLLLSKRQKGKNWVGPSRCLGGEAGV